LVEASIFAKCGKVPPSRICWPHEIGKRESFLLPGHDDLSRVNQFQRTFYRPVESMAAQAEKSRFWAAASSSEGEQGSDSDSFSDVAPAAKAVDRKFAQTYSRRTRSVSSSRPRTGNGIPCRR
jgi:hypothetical protein